MAHYDKYEPYAGGTRALLAADWDADDLHKVVAVGLDANGRVVKGKGASGILGVLVLNKLKKADQVVDIMTDGDISDFKPYNAADSVEGTSAPGTKFYAADDGSINTTNTGVYVGMTIEIDRLVVRVQAGA